METKTQKQWLERDLERALAKYGPDSPSVKDLKAQIASLGTVRHPSQLAALNSDNYHGGVLKVPDSAQPDPDQLALHNRMEVELPGYLRNLDKRDPEQSRSGESTSQDKPEAS